MPEPGALRRRAVTVAAFLAALAALGSSPAGAVAATTTTLPPGIPAAVVQADEICARANRDLMAALVQVERNRSTRRVSDEVRNRTARPADVTAYATRIAIPRLREMVRELRAVRYPAANAAVMAEILDQYAAALDQLAATPALAQRADPLRGPVRRLREIRFAKEGAAGEVGFRACGSTDRAAFAPAPAPR